MSLEYLQENEQDEVDFIPADKHKIFCKFIDHFGCAQPGMPKVLKITYCNIFTTPQGKHER